MLAALRTSRGRHVRRASGRRKAVAAVAVVAASGLALTVPSAGVASAADACTTPQLSDVMISQGLPSYGMLAYGKTTLVKLFLNTPSCLPAGASVSVTGASLQVSSSPDPIELQGVFPLPPLGPPSTSPVPASASDVMFLVPGSALKPVTSPVTFSAKVDYVVRTATNTLSDTVTFATAPGTTNPLSAAVAPAVLPAGVLVVPMGDVSKGAAAQYPAAAQSALEDGMTALNRLLPVADAGGLSHHLNAGMLNLGAHLDSVTNTTVNYMSTGSYCGSNADMPYISAGLEAMRVAWNSVSSNERAQTALGEIWQGVSSGPNTNSGSGCAEGYAQLPGTAGWGRTIASSLQGGSTLLPVPITGTLAAHEILHTVGGVARTDVRNDGTQHSKNVAADVTAPNRAYNLYSQRWLPDSKTVMRYMSSGWHDGNSLYEKEDWDWMQCSVQPVPANPVTGKQCAAPGQLTYAGAGPPGSGTFVVTGTTDGTSAGTDAYSYESTDGRTDPTDDSSDYRLVQKDANGNVLSDTGVPVHSTYDDGGQPPASTPVRGTFGVAITARAATSRIELRRTTSTGSVLLYGRDRNTPPQIVAAQVQGHSIAVSARDEDPQSLRLDLFLQCPNSTSPLVTAARPTVIGGVAVFSTDYDSSLGCPTGTLSYRVTDGFSSTSQTDLTTTAGTAIGAAAIYAPTANAKLTSFANIAVAGAGRDETGADATDLVWSLTGPTSVADVHGATASFVPPATGFAAGTYTLTLKAFAGSRLFATTTRDLLIRSDRDHDGIPDDEESWPCYGSGAADDPANALQDSDGDGIANVVDAAPCASASTVTASFNPVSLYKTSSGLPVTVYLTNSKVDLRTLTKDDLFITQIAGFATANLLGKATALPAISYSITSPTTATVKFDRGLLCQALQSRPGLLGYVPLFVGTLDGRVRGADPAAPTVFP